MILIGIELAGVGLIAYPSLANWWNNYHQYRAVNAYAEKVSSLSKDEYDQIISDAEAYNEEIAATGLNWNLSDEQMARYEALLNIDDTSIMGYINIPKIRITLPVYHGVDDEVLQVAIGHLAGTSLPVGGPSTHCVVSGHRGLPSARLFTDLDKLVEGDTFMLNVLDRTLTYEVDQIRIVEPTDLSDIRIEEGKDYCTLVTCTPYGINTHRLLVRGHRVANADGDADVVADAVQIDPTLEALYMSAIILVVLVLALFTRSMALRRRLNMEEIRRLLRWPRDRH